MAMSSAMNRYRKTLTSLKSHYKLPVLALTGLSLLVLVASPFYLLRHPSIQVVHAAANSGKDSGAALFHEKGCEHCHGVNGRGGDLGPDLSTVGKRLKKEQIEHQIHDGGAAMPAFGDVLQPDEIKDLVDFLHAKRKAPKKALPAAKPSTPDTP
jgi:mono/diheme cytochrome c family protein